MLRPNCIRTILRISPDRMIAPVPPSERVVRRYHRALLKTLSTSPLLKAFGKRLQLQLSLSDSAFDFAMSVKKAFGEPVAAATDTTKDLDVGEIVNQSQEAEDGQYQRTISSRQIHVGFLHSSPSHQHPNSITDLEPRSCP